jgi:putative endonuclease
MWYIYRIINENGNFNYIGITENPESRLRRHNDGSTRSTKPYRPFNKIDILRKCNSRIEARKWEKYYKSGIGRELTKRGVVHR